MSNLMLHSGSRTVTRDELATIEAPAPTRTWFPVAHHAVLARAENLLTGAGFRIEKSHYGLGRNGHRFFGVLDLAVPVAHSDGVKLAVGIRNSTDQTFPIGLAAGTRVTVCDNLAFSAELVVTRKHTRHGMDRWTEGIGFAVDRLDQFRAAETYRIKRLMGTVLNPDTADAVLLRAFERGIIGPRQLPDAIRQWREPAFDWGTPGTAWHLYNAMTHALNPTAQSNPQRHAGLTMKLMAHFAPVIGGDGASLMDGSSAIAPVRDTDDSEPETIPADDVEIIVPNPFPNRYGVRPDADLLD